MLRQSLRDEVQAIDLGCHLYPVNSIGYGGVHNNFIEMLDWLGGEDGSAEKDGNLVARVEAFAQQCDEYKDLLRAGIEAKRTASRAMIRKVPEQLNDLLSSLTDADAASAAADAANALKKDAADAAAAATPAPSPLLVAINGVGEALQERAKAALGTFKEAIASLVVFFEEEYAPHAREVPGCGGLADGEAVYALCLRYHTTTEMTPEEVHQLGLTEVARIQGRCVHVDGGRGGRGREVWGGE
jgi:uncharacterized protein (DUF885 family)